MKKILFIALIVSVGLTSCGLFKSITTDRNRQKDHTKSDSTYIETVKDNSIITTVTKLDTVIKTPEVHIESIKPAEIDSSGVIFAKLDTLMIRVKVKYNALKKVFVFDITKHSELMPLTIDIIKTEARDIKETNTGRTQKNIKSKSNTKIKKSEPNIKAIITLIGSLFLIFIAIWLFLRYKAARI